MVMKKSFKKPRRDSNGDAETAKEAYKDANQRGRAASSGYMGPSINNRSPKLKTETYIKADSRGTADAKNALSRRALAPRTGPSAGGQSSLYARLTGGGLKNQGK